MAAPVADVFEPAGFISLKQPRKAWSERPTIGSTLHLEFYRVACRTIQFASISSAAGAMVSSIWLYSPGPPV